MNGKVIAVDTLRALADRWATDRNYTGSPSDDIRALIDEPTASQKPEAVRLRDELRERAEFEAWASTGSYDFTQDPSGAYVNQCTHYAWRGWQAALAASGKQQPDAPQFHHVKKVAEHFNMAVTPKDMAEAIAGAPNSLFSMEAAHKAFAATGKQQVGESLTDTYVQTVPDKCDRIVWRGHYYHLPIKQVGEVQGDALLGYVRAAAIKALREDDEVTGVMIHVEEPTDSVPVYLAARQPMGQEPVGTTFLCPGKNNDKTQCNFMRKDVPEGTLLYAAATPPAQSEDLGQVIEQIAQQWDGCSYDAVGETIEIGGAIRAAGKRLADSKGAQS